MVDNLLDYIVELHDIMFVDKNYPVIKRMINDYPELLNKLMPEIISNLTTNICKQPLLFKFIFGELSHLTNDEFIPEIIFIINNDLDLILKKHKTLLWYVITNPEIKKLFLDAVRFHYVMPSNLIYTIIRKEYFTVDEIIDNFISDEIRVMYSYCDKKYLSYELIGSYLDRNPIMIIIDKPHIFDYDNISMFDFLMNNYIKKIYCENEMRSIVHNDVSQLLIQQLFTHKIIECLVKNYTQYLNIIINNTSIWAYIKTDFSPSNSNIQNFIMNNLFIEFNDNSDLKLIQILEYIRMYDDHFSMAKCMYDRFTQHQKMIIISYYCNSQNNNDPIINTIMHFEPNTDKIHDNFFYQISTNDIIKMIKYSNIFSFDPQIFENFIVYYLYIRHIIRPDDIFKKFLNLYPCYPDIVIENKKVTQFKIMDRNLKVQDLVCIDKLMD